MEDECLKKELTYLKNLIDKHNASSNTFRPYQHKTIQFKPTNFGQYNVNVVRPKLDTQTARTFQTHYSRTPNHARFNPLTRYNPFKIVKTNTTSSNNQTEKRTVTISENKNLIRTKSNLPSQTVINITAISPQTGDKVIKQKATNLLPLKTKYKLIKNRKVCPKPSSTFELAISSTPLVKSSSISASKKSLVNKFKLVTPILIPSKLTPKKPFNNLSKHKWWQYRPGYYGILKYQKYRYSKTKPSREKFHFNKNKPTMTKAKPNNGEKNLKLVSIGGLMYRVTTTKLSRAQTPKKQLKWVSKVNMKSSPKFVYVSGIKYKVSQKGNILKRISTSSPSKWENSTKKWTTSFKTFNRSRIDLGRKTFVKNHNGVFVASQANETRIFVNRAKFKSIHRVLKRTKKKLLTKNNQHCLFYIRFGKCHKGNECNFAHDPEKVAVCTRFLRGTCKISNCPFSHKMAPEKMPVCSYFLQGRCSNDNCPYRHVKVSSSAEVCKDFVKGYCPTGDKCQKQHIFDCQEFKIKGTCSKGKSCLLSHKRKTRKRKILRQTLTEATAVNLEESKKCNLEKLPSFISIESSPANEMGFSVLEEPRKESPLKIRPRFLKMGK